MDAILLSLKDIQGFDCTAKIQKIKFMKFLDGSSRTKQVQTLIYRDACVFRVNHAILRVLKS